MDDPLNTSNLHRQAINAALSNDWNQAIALNEKIIKVEPKNPDCLNRLAKAFFEIGKISQAKKLYQEVLDIDPYNGIAQKNLKRISSLRKNGDPKNNQVDNLHNGEVKSRISPSLFLQEPGVTKIVSLIKVAEPQKLSKLFAGQEVKIIPKSRQIYITDTEHSYLGALPDDISHLLLRFIKGGNKYSAWIKSVKPNGMSLLIREIYRAKRFRNQPSFRDEMHIISLPSDHITLSDEPISEDFSPSEDAE